MASCIERPHPFTRQEGEKKNYNGKNQKSNKFTQLGPRTALEIKSSGLCCLTQIKFPVKMLPISEHRPKHFEALSYL